MKSAIRLLGFLSITSALAIGVNAQSFLTDDLVAYYPFNSNADDQSGNGKHLSVPETALQRDVGWTKSPLVSFADPAAHVAGPHSLFDRKPNWTWSAWVKTSPESLPSSPQSVYMEVSQGPVGGILYPIFGIALSSQEIHVSSWNADFAPPQSWKNAVFPIELGSEFHHVTLTLEGGDANRGTLRYYIDGVLRGSTDHQSVYDNSGRPLLTVMGEDLRYPATHFFGKLDEIRVYNRTFSPSEVRQLYDYERPKLSDGLVVYYPFNGNANDESGKRNDGLVQGAQLTVDRFGRASHAYGFTSSDQHITTSASTEFPVGTGDFSVSLWVALSGFIDDPQMLFANGGVNQFQLDIGPSGTASAPLDFLTGGDYGAPDVHTTGVPWTPGEWYNLQVVRSQNTVTIYRDGVAIGQNQVTSGNNVVERLRNLRFGHGFAPQQHQLYGKLDDIRVFNRALSEAEIRQLYQIELMGFPSLSVIVKTVRVDLLLETGRKYQLESSVDMRTWTRVGMPFVGTAAQVSQDFDVAETGRCFRIVELP